MVWYSHLLKNFPQLVILTVKGFGMANKAEVDVFLELSCFFDDPADVGNWISGSSAFSKTSLKQPKSKFRCCLNTLCTYKHIHIRDRGEGRKEGREEGRKDSLKY